MNEVPIPEKRSRRFAIATIAASGLVVVVAIVVGAAVFRSLDHEQELCRKLRARDLEPLFREEVKTAKRAPVGPEEGVRCVAAAEDGTGNVDVRILDGTAEEVQGYLATLEDQYRFNRRTPVAVPGLADRAVWVHAGPEGYFSELTAVSATRFVHVELATWHVDEDVAHRAAEMLARRAL